MATLFGITGSYSKPVRISSRYYGHINIGSYNPASHNPARSTDLDPYPQVPDMYYMAVDSILNGSSYYTGKAITITGNFGSFVISGAKEQGVFKWDSSGGAWVQFQNIAVNDWVLTDYYNSTYSDYFWQVSNVTSIDSWAWTAVKHPAGTATDRQVVFVSEYGNNTCLAIRTY